MTHIVIEIKQGEIACIATNDENVKITLINHDENWQDKSTYQPDSVMTNEGLKEYIEKLQFDPES